MRRVGVLVFAVTVLVLGLVVVVPFVTQKREFPAELMIPWPGLGGPVDKLAPNQTLCISGVTAEHHAQVARIYVTPYRRPGPRLVLTLTGPRYRARGSLAGGYSRPGNYPLPLKEAPPRDMLVTACIHNSGQRKVGLYAYPSRLGARPAATRDGQPLEVPPVFGLWEAGRHSVGERLSLTLQRVALFRGPLAHAWIVAAALIVAVVALIAAFAIALRLSMPPKR